MNPSLDLQKKSDLNYDTVPFSDLSDIAFRSQLRQGIEVATDLINEVKNITGELTYENTVGKIDLALEALHRVVNPLMRYRSLRASAEILSIIKDQLPGADKLTMDITIDKDIYRKIKSVRNLNNLTAEQINVVNLVLKEFEENGVHLSSDKQVIYNSLTEKIKRLEAEFIENIQNDENEFTVIIEDEREVKGVPDSILELALNRGRKLGVPGWVFSIKGAEFGPAISFGQSSKFRKMLYEKRASLGHSGQISNQEISLKLLQLRSEKAHLLGFESHAALKVRQKEGCSPNFILDLLESEKSELTANAASQLKELSELSEDSEVMNVWDFHYLKQLKHKNKSGGSLLTFEVSTLMRGIFSVLGRIFQISFMVDKSIEVYSDQGVDVYRIENIAGRTIGIIYLDLFSRENKRSGNSMAPIREKGRYLEREVIPQVVVSTNIVFEDRDKISLHDVTRILHELGHGLHALMSDHSLPRLNSVSNCPMSMIELPSTLLEGLVTVPDCLKEFLGVSPLNAEELLEATNSTNDPYTELFTVSNGIYDLRLHILNDFSPLQNWGRYEKENLRTDLMNISLPEGFPVSAYSFRHIMAGGYDAGYYSYSLSRQFSSKIFERWLACGIFNLGFCKKLKGSIYSQGALLSLESVKIYVEDISSSEFLGH